MSETAKAEPAFSSAVWTWEGFRHGLRMGLAVLPGMLVFGLAVGTTAARKGLSFADSVLMNAFVYAGAAQMIALEIWPQVLTWASIAAIAAVTAIVNARLILMSASMQPWFRALPNSQSYPALFLLTDPGWLLAMRYRADGGSDYAVFAGSAVLFFTGWLAATSVGYFAGAMISDPRAFGLDLVMPVFFAVLLIPIWRGVYRAIPWAVAGVVALATEWLVPGWWFIIAGSIAGAVVGGFLADEEATA